MRYPIWLFMLLLFTGACKKNTPSSSGSIYGSWELRETSGASLPGSTKYAPGNGNILDYSGTNYMIYRPGQPTKTGSFKIVADLTASENICLLLPKGKFTNRLIYDANDSTAKIFYQVDGDKLTFYSGCYAYDAGHSETYERRKAVD